MKFVMRFTPKNFHWQVETWVTARDWEHAREKFKARKIPMAKNTLLEIWGVKKASETNTILKRSGKPQMRMILIRKAPETILEYYNIMIL